MADDAKKDEKSEETEAKSEGGGSKVILIIIVVLLLLLLIIGGIVGYFLLSSNDNPDQQNAQGQGQQQNQKVREVKKEAESMEIGPIYPLDPFTVNLKSSGATRYLKCTINLEIDAPETQPELDKMKPLIRDLIIRILSSKTVPQISTAKGKQKLKAEIRKNINPKLATGEIRNVYFTAFVIQ